MQWRQCIHPLTTSYHNNQGKTFRHNSTAKLVLCCKIFMLICVLIFTLQPIPQMAHSLMASLGFHHAVANGAAQFTEAGQLLWGFPQAAQAATPTPGVLTPMIPPTFTVSIDAANTGTVDGLCLTVPINTCPSVVSPENVVDGDTENAGRLTVPVAVSASAMLAVEDTDTYPAGSFVGFVLEDETGLGLSLLNGMSISVYNDGIQQESASSANLVDLPLLGSLFTVGFTTTVSFDEVQIEVESLAGVLYDYSVYYAVVQTPIGATPTATPTGTSTALPTTTPTPTGTETALPTTTGTMTGTATAVPTETLVPTITGTTTGTATTVSTATSVPTATGTTTGTATTVSTNTPTGTGTSTALPTTTPTPTGTTTTVPTATLMQTPTAPTTITPTVPPIPTATVTATPTPTRMLTATPTGTPTLVPNGTSTAVTPTATITPTPVPTVDRNDSSKFFYFLPLVYEESRCEELFELCLQSANGVNP